MFFVEDHIMGFMLCLLVMFLGSSDSILFVDLMMF